MWICSANWFEQFGASWFVFEMRHFSGFLFFCSKDVVERHFAIAFAFQVAHRARRNFDFFSSLFFSRFFDDRLQRHGQPAIRTVFALVWRRRHLLKNARFVAARRGSSVIVCHSLCELRSKMQLCDGTYAQRKIVGALACPNKCVSFACYIRVGVLDSRRWLGSATTHSNWFR